MTTNRSLSRISVRLAAGALVAVMAAGQAHAQFPEDALRLGLPGYGVGARALGMGNAYTGVANDFSAIYWNPAGLAQIRNPELSLGLSYLNNQDQSTFFTDQMSYTNNSTNLNTAGLVYPVTVRRGSFVIALGFDRESNFTTGLQFLGFNPNSSIIQTYARDSSYYPSDLSNNLAYQLYLANLDTVNGRFISPIRNRVTQSGTVTEGGGLNNWSAAAAVDVARDLSVGVTLTGLSGSYRYDRSFYEQDLRNLYQVFPFDFKKLSLTDFIEGDITGFNAKFGLMYRVPDRFRIGIAAKTPTSFHVSENFGTSAESEFDDGSVYPVDGPFQTTGSDEYDVHTPWVFSAGASVMLRNLMLAADVEYTDWSQLEFANANADVMAENQTIKDIFTGTANLGLGAEYEIPDAGVRLRGGYMLRPSPYKGDPSSFNQQYITGGLGVLLGGTTMVDLGYAHGWWKTYRVNYDATSPVDEDVTVNNFLLTFSFRF